MDRTMIAFNLPNTFTVLLMAAAGYALAALLYNLLGFNRSQYAAAA